MFITIVRAGAVGAGAASRYGSDFDQKMRLLASYALLPGIYLNGSELQVKIITHTRYKLELELRDLNRNERENHTVLEIIYHS
jgi:hypothetical protein